MEAMPTLPRIVSRRHLGHLLGYPSEVLEEVAAESDAYYRPFWQRRPDKKPRRIDHPTGLLKSIQKRIARRLLALIPLPRELMGGVRGRSVLSNASPHVCQPEVVRVDLADYFGEVTNRAIADAWKRWFGPGDRVTWLVTRLTTFQGHLPQGAPTSTGLANIVLAPMLEKIRSACVARGFNLTVYVDDITISGPSARDAINGVARVLSQNGLPVGRGKTRVMPQSGRQEVTGVVVNRKLSNGRRRLHDLRRRVLRSEQSETCLASLQGAIAHVKSISPSQASAIQRVLDRASAGDACRGR
jgi:RNA-directed DNA polymerase